MGRENKKRGNEERIMIKRGIEKTKLERERERERERGREREKKSKNKERSRMDAFSSNKFMQECKKANTVVGKVTFEQKR
jgi:hypothetical protein